MTSLSACPMIGPCVTAAFDAVYKAAENYPNELFLISKTAFKVTNVAGPLAVAALNAGSQSLGWKWTQQVYNEGLLNEEGEKSAGHKYVPYMLATGALSLIQITTGAISGFPSDANYPFMLNGTVSSIMGNASCTAAGCVAKAGESIFNCTLNFFAESFKSSDSFNVAGWISSDIANQLYQIGGVNMVASGAILGFNFFQVWNEVKVTKTVNPVALVACTGAVFMFLYGLILVYSTSLIPYEQDARQEWKNCEVIS